jgi:hypothetical protein
MPELAGTDRDPPARQPSGRGILTVFDGRQAFRKVALSVGESVVIGRTEKATLTIDDPELNAAHCEVAWSGRRALVRDLGSMKGIAVGGEFIAMGIVDPGGFFVAGRTTFQIFAEAATPPRDIPPSPEQLAKVARAKTALGPIDGALYAVVDAARDPKALVLLQESLDDHQNLYEGVAGRALDDVAPYLVRFRPGSSLLDRLLLGGWGEAWGVFLRSTASPKDVRRHLRRFLMAQDEDTLERLYFRFYDPRVLREFWSVATPRQRDELCAGLDGFVLEDGAGEPLELSAKREPMGEGG